MGAVSDNWQKQYMDVYVHISIHADMLAVFILIDIQLNIYDTLFNNGNMSRCELEKRFV